MKKLFSILAALAVAVSVTASAQRAGEFNLSNNEDWSHSGVFSELGVGVTLGDLDADLGLSLGLGYRYHINNGFCWDIAKVTYYVPCVTTAFAESSSMRFISAIRYNSAPLLGDMPLYATFGVGYQLNVDDTDRWKGFAYEIGLGVNMSRSCSLGLVWEGNVAHYDTYYGSENANFGILGAKLGVQF